MPGNDHAQFQATGNTGQPETPYPFSATPPWTDQ